MNLSVEQQLGRITGVDTTGQPDGASSLPTGFEGGSMSAANEALGVQLAATRHDHTVGLHSALLNVMNDSVRRLLENF